MSRHGTSRKTTTSLATDVRRAYGERVGIDAARRERPDLLVLDLMMPEVNLRRGRGAQPTSGYGSYSYRGTAWRLIKRGRAAKPPRIIGTSG